MVSVEVFVLEISLLMFVEVRSYEILIVLHIVQLEILKSVL